MSLIIFLLILVGLILVHELGHFIAAKIAGARVDEFSIGFPPRIFSVKWGETNYSFGILLLGGYVSIWGEDATPEAKHDTRALSNKPRLVQALVLIAGIVMNLLAAWLLLAAGYAAGMPASAESFNPGQVANVKTEVVGVLPGSPADKAGLEAGDTVIDVQTGTTLLAPNSDATDVTTFIGNHQNESILFEVMRNGQQKEFLAAPTAGLVPGKKVVGVELDDIGILKLALLPALKESAEVEWQMISGTVTGLGGFLQGLFLGHPDFSDVSGPIGIAGAGSTAVQEGFSTTIILTALISVSLAIFNILPIPGLDGGRLLILIIEAIIRRPLSQKVANAITLTGFAFLIILILLVSAHDIVKLVG